MKNKKIDFLLCVNILLLVFSSSLSALSYQDFFDVCDSDGFCYFSEYDDLEGAQRWCENWIAGPDNGNDRYKEAVGCARVPNESFGDLSCNANLNVNPTVVVNGVCKLAFRCPFPQGHPQEGEWDPNTRPAINKYCPGAEDGGKMLGQCGPGLCGEGNPINPVTGNKFQTETDYTSSIDGGLTFNRYYNSQDTQVHAILGLKWMADYFQYVSLATSDGRTVAVRRPDGQRLRFRTTGGTATLPATTEGVDGADVIETLNRKTSGGTITGWELVLEDDTVENYDASGRLESIVDREGKTQTLDYNVSVVNGGDGNSNTLDKVTGPYGRTIQFQYSNDRLSTMIDPAGETYTYQYDANNNLSSVTYPDETPGDNTDNPIRVYHYEDINFPNYLTGITNENADRYVTWGYHPDGKASYVEYANHVERMDFIYNNSSTTITDSQSQTYTYHFDTLHGSSMITQIDGDQCNHCSNQFTNADYDDNGFLTEKIDYKLNKTTYVNNARGLETSRTEAVGTLEERTITTEWHPTFRLPTRITEPGKVTTFTYDVQGRLLERKQERTP